MFGERFSNCKLHLFFLLILVPSAVRAETLEHLIEELKASNPEVRSLEDGEKAAKERVAQFGALDDPMFELKAMNIPTGNASLKRMSMSGVEAHVSQKIPFPLKLVFEKKIGRLKYSEVQAAREEGVNAVVAAFKMAYYDYGRTHEELFIFERSRKRLTALLNITQARYAAGQSAFEDALKTEIEIENVTAQIIEFTNYKKALIVRLNASLNRPLETSIKFSWSDLSDTSLRFNLSELVSMATEHRPLLKQAEYRSVESVYAHKLARAGYLPDFELGAGYMMRENIPGEAIGGENLFSGGVAINVPWLWTLPRHSKSVSQAAFERSAQKNSETAIKNEISSEVSRLYHEARTLRSKIGLYQTKIVPQAVAAFEATLKSYEAGLADFENVVMSELGLLQHELEGLRYRYENQKKLAELDAAVGRSL